MFPKSELFHIFAVLINRQAKAKFKIIYSEETIRFLNSLDEKARAKIMYNVNKSKYVIDKELFKKLDDADDI